MQRGRWFRLVLVVSLMSGGSVIGVVDPASAVPPTEVHQGASLTGRWRSVATSASGEVAVGGRDFSSQGSKLRITTNRGTSWSEIASSAVQQWMSVDVSANGQVIVASGYLGSTYTVRRSIDQGQTWSTLLSSTTDEYPYLAMSDDGQRILVTGGPSNQMSLLVSTNGGASWVTTASAAPWNSVAVSGDGGTMYASRFGSLSKSTDNGSTWTVLSGAGTHNFTSVSTSTNGSVVLGVVSYEQPGVGAFFSRDGGISFQAATGVGASFVNQLAVGTVSGDGSTLIATSYGTVPRVSSDGGLTWAPGQFTALGWLAFAAAESGTVVHAVAEASGFHTYRPVPAPTISFTSRPSVSSAGGQYLEVIGTSFKNVQSVVFSGQVVQHQVESPTAISFTTPRTSSTTATIVVTTASGTATTSLPVYVPVAPRIDSVSPVSGTWRGGTRVTLSGANFSDVIRVDIGGVEAEIDVLNETEIEVIAPPGRVGLSDVRVVAPVGTTTASRSYRYTWNRRSVLPAWRFVGPSEAFDAMVRTVAVGTNGWLYMGGMFLDAAGIPTADGIVAWDGTSWRALGDNGSNNGALYNDNASISFVHSIVVDPSGIVYAGGDVSLTAGNEVGVVKWNGTSWSALGSGLDGTVTTMAVDATGDLFVGGYFQNAGGVQVNGLARWNGTSWSALPNYSNFGVVNDVVVDGGDVYIAGDFENLAGLPTADYVARWDGSTWHPLGSDGAGDGFLEYPAQSILVDGSGSSRRVFVAPCSGSRGPGTFVFTNGGWSAVSSTNLDNGCVNDMELLDDGRLVVVGDFDGDDDQSIRGVAVLEDGVWLPGGRAAAPNSIVKFGNPSRLLMGNWSPNVEGAQDYAVVTGVVETFIGSNASDLAPSSGTTLGGTTVVIRGTGFGSGTDVIFGDIPATSVTYVSDTEIHAVTPPQAESLVDVHVYDSRRFSTLAQRFRYVAPDPNILPATGGGSDLLVIILATGVMLLASGVAIRSRRHRRV